MDLTKKRKLDENGVGLTVSDMDPSVPKLTPEDVRKIVDRIVDKGKLIDIVANAASRHVDVLDAVRSLADSDSSQRKLFIRGLGWDTTTEGLRSLFSSYGELEEAVVILDKQTGKSKGYGFVTFKHVDGALLALKEPSKRIDGRVTVTQLAAAGNSSSTTNSTDVSSRKIYVWEVPHDMSPDKLLSHFLSYGEIEEGPLGFDRFTGKSKGFALFVYKNPEGAQAALANPLKIIDGKQLNCKLANVDGKKGKQGDGVQVPGPIGGAAGNDGIGGMGMGSIPGSQYPGPGGIGSYGGFHGGPPHFDKKQFVTFMKRYIKLLTPKLEGEQQDIFKKNIEGATKFLLSKLSDLQFFVGESMHDDGGLVFAYYKEGATDPTFLYFAHGLKEIKC